MKVKLIIIIYPQNTDFHFTPIDLLNLNILYSFISEILAINKIGAVASKPIVATGHTETTLIYSSTI